MSRISPEHPPRAYAFCAKASHQDTHLCVILFDEPASSSRGIKSSLLDCTPQFLKNERELHFSLDKIKYIM